MTKSKQKTKEKKSSVLHFVCTTQALTMTTESNTIAKAMHMFSISIFFGCSTWVSFVAGIVMFKTLPRHVFGKLQSKLFPAFFQFTSLTLIIAILTLVFGLNQEWTSTSVLLVSSSLFFQLLNLVWLEPVTTKIMFERHILERSLKTGHEVGTLTPDTALARENKDLKAITRRFGMWHGMSATGTLIAWGCVAYHMFLFFC